MASVLSTLFPEFNFSIHFFVSELACSKLLWLLLSVHSTVFGSGLAQTILKLFLLPEKLKLSTRAVLWVLVLEHVNSLGIDIAV